MRLLRAWRASWLVRSGVRWVIERVMESHRVHARATSVRHLVRHLNAGVTRGFRVNSGV